MKTYKQQAGGGKAHQTNEEKHSTQELVGRFCVYHVKEGKKKKKKKDLTTMHVRQRIDR